MRLLVCMIGIVAVLASIAIDAPAQTATGTQQEMNFRWNEFWEVERFHGTLESIVEPDHRNLAPNSGEARYDGSTVEIPIWFSVPFTIFGDDFHPDDPLYGDYTIQAGIGGFFKFTTDDTPIDLPYLTSYYLEPDSGDFSKLIMPYWGAFETFGTPGEGIYYKYEDAPNTITGLDLLTIEWRVRHAGDVSGPVGIFQAKVILMDKKWPSGQHYVTIEFYYGTEPLSWQPPTMREQMLRGAAVGLKNRGQIDATAAYWGRYYNVDLHNHGYGLDDGNTLMITPPTLFSEAWPAITRVPVHTIGNTPMPEWFSFVESADGSATHSNYFHYSYPPKNSDPPSREEGAYRVKPIDSDLLSVGTRTQPATPPQEDPCSIVFDDREELIVFGTFANLGTDSLYRVPIQANIFRGDLPAGTLNDTIASIAPGATLTIPFRDTLNTGQNPLPPGAYTLCMHHGSPSDQYRGNDTVCTHFSIRQVRDVGVIDLIAPILGLPPDYTVLPPDQAITVQVRLANLGKTIEKNMRGGFRILDRTGKELYREITSIPDSLLPDEERTITLGRWIPGAPGLYYIEAFSLMSGDQVPDNDTVRGEQRCRFLWWGSRTRGKDAQHVPFEIRPEHDMGVNNPATHPHFPFTGSTVSAPFRVAAFFRNHGTEAETNVPVTVRIFNVPTGGTSLRELNENIPSVPTGSAREHRFQQLTGLSAGTYYAEVEVSAPSDAVAGNNRARWPFRIGTNGVEQEHEEARLLVHPNPAQEEATVTYALRKAGIVRLGLYDTYGRQVADQAERREAGRWETRIDLEDLPAGIYTVKVESRGEPSRTGRLVVVR